MKELERANELLLEIGSCKGQLSEWEARAQREIEAVKKRYSAHLEELRQELKASESKLLGLMKEKRAVIFDGTDQVELEAGILLHGTQDKVRIPRDALQRIEAQGWTEAVKVAKSVDRGVVEKWPLERLILIGADRKEKEVFSYELKEAR
ncbi:MAG: host-nuclease inhibitor Gam family protein [Deltaproteobacteria bacterium]|nr:host-nuclease inhibitor Gam family protein [Deltaproteobacteria bacterium]